MSHGNFFAIGADEFAAACDLGIKPAVSLLVLARGTGKDNATTSWSAQAIFEKTGIAWRRAKEAIEALCAADIVKVLKAGKKPRYKISKPKDDAKLIWLPNELIDGAGGEVPPVTKLRETGELVLLQKFIELYSAHDIDNDGGLPRSLAWQIYSRETICPIGPFILYGFESKDTKARAVGSLAALNGEEDAAGNKGAWVVLSPLANLGLIQKVSYMAESDEHDSELIYPVNDETSQAIGVIHNWLEESGGEGFARQIGFYDSIGIAPKHIGKAAMVGLFRMTYRPKTGKTSRWWALEREQTEAMVANVESICKARSNVVDIKAFKGL
ncbi:hypothetical protein [Pseudomonas fluorescens]|uniref:hypothetical protein n=1 Tax=Pseudomonas fluorescens TaxID=294 RepID=UPI0016566ACC|nr:hypothetical protein [Pseudomonas fluorescens]MBC8787103.1 hypothetical protein [Pseudomonas fluorescens]